MFILCNQIIMIVFINLFFFIVLFLFIYVW